MNSDKNYRQVPAGKLVPGVVTVDIGPDEVLGIKASVWWPAQDGEEAVKNDFDDIATAFEEAEIARVRHGLPEVVVALQNGIEWQAAWGKISAHSGSKEPIGDVSGAGLTSEEAYDLAADLEAESDA